MSGNGKTRLTSMIDEVRLKLLRVIYLLNEILDDVDLYDDYVEKLKESVDEIEAREYARVMLKKLEKVRDELDDNYFTIKTIYNNLERRV